MKKILVSGALFLFPVLAFAQVPAQTTLQQLIVSIGNIVNIAIPIAFALGLLFFFYGLAKFILASGNEDAKDQGKRIMIWGLVALFVMASVWGIVKVAQVTFGIGNTTSQTVPTVNP